MLRYKGLSLVCVARRIKHVDVEKELVPPACKAPPYTPLADRGRKLHLVRDKVWQTVDKAVYFLLPFVLHLTPVGSGFAK